MRRFREDSGNAGMVARELPSDEVLASWQHVEQRALDLRAAGMPGTLRELRVRAYLDLLQERDSRTGPPFPPPTAGRTGQAERPGPHRGQRPGARRDGAAAPAGPPARAETRPRRARRPGRPGRDGGPGSGPGSATGSPGRATGPSVAALVTITVPLATTSASPRPLARPAGSGRWTPTTPATWSPQRPGTPTPGGA